MINLELKGQTFTILGLRGSGKSTLADLILSSFGGQAVYYDTLYEAAKDSAFDVYQPSDRHSVPELEAFLNLVIPKTMTQVPKYSLIVIDECNRFAPPKPAPLPRTIADLNDICRHYGVSVGFIARRPVQLNQDLTELASYIFIFQLTGKNDIQYLNNIADGLGDSVKKLQKFEFVMVHPNRSYDICNPIQARPEWLANAKKLIDK